MNSFIEIIPAHPVATMRRVGAYGEGNFLLMQQMKEWISEQALWTQDGVIYGIAQDNMAQTPPEKCRYDVCFVTQAVTKHPAITYGTLPAGKYLVFEVEHTTQAVKAFWNSVMTVLSQEKKALDASRPILERYPRALVEKGRCEFCVPVL